ncbi:MAG: amino acid--tRNA ligase-related protein [Candidatus Nanoarchaeia archaeon]
MNVNKHIEQMNPEERRIHLVLVESAARRGAYKCWENKGWPMVAVPHMVNVTGACEQVDTLFNFDHFGEEGYLNQTGQTALEISLTNPALAGVCTEIKSFRKEAKVDDRHLTEFSLLEFEGVYEEGEDGFDILLNNIEGTIRSMIEGTLENATPSLEALGVNINFVKNLLTQPFARVEYDEAVKLVGKQWGEDLNQHDEQLIVQELGNGRPTFVMRYPEEIKFFNMKRDANYKNPNTCNGNPHRVLSSDLLMPYSGECVGAAVREHNPVRLRERLLVSEMFRQLQVRGKGIEDFEEYLGAVEANPRPHAGCGIGMVRVIQSMMQTFDIRFAATYLMNAGTGLKFSASYTPEVEKSVVLTV